MTHHHAVLIATTHPLDYEVETECAVPVHAQYRLAQFGIADVRALITTAHRRPLGKESMQTLLVATEFITEEAQQALLKIIEEPPLSTKFIFVIPTGYYFLPTLESRFERSKDSNSSYDTTVFDTFKDASYAQRLVLIERAIKNKDQAWLSAMKQGLTSFLLHHRHKLSTRDLVEMDFVLRLLLTRGASNKFLLEHLALTLKT